MLFRSNLVITLEGHEDSVTSVVFSVDGNKVISGSKDKTIRIWEAQTGKAAGEPLRGHFSAVLALTVSADGKWVASGSRDGTLRIWDMATVSEVRVLNDYYSELSSIAFTPDSKSLISGLYKDRFNSGAHFKVMDVRTGEYFARVETINTERSCPLFFSPNGHEFASGSSDGTIRVWDTRACTDIELYNADDTDEDDTDYTELGEEELRIRWNASRAHRYDADDDGWIRDRGNRNLLLWVPMQYRRDIKYGAKLVIGAPGVDTVRPEVDYRKLFKYSGERWTDIYNVRG